jgi:hypothetical protein
MMKSFLVIASLVLFQPAYAEDSAAELPLAARQALTRWNFKFKSFNQDDYTKEVRELLGSQPPMKISGDFNGDKTPDYVVLGEAEKQQFALAIVSDKKDFKVVTIDKWSLPNFKKSEVPGDKGIENGVPVYVAPAGGSLADGYKEKNKRDVIQLEAFGGAVELYAIENFKAVHLNKKN